MILASGCFDGLHAGHVAYLKAAARLGHDLYVAVAPDAYIREAKGREPYWSQQDRATAVMALSCVTDTTLQDTTSVAEVIRRAKPAQFVKGWDWRNRLPADVIQACEDVGCAITFIHTPGRHTSEARG